MLVAAFGDPGHAFPAIALARGLVARGHEVLVQTWRRWQSFVEAEGMRFSAAPEYEVFPGAGTTSLSPYAAAVRACAETRPLVREFDPHVVVVDVLTLAAAFAAEAERRPWVTLIPHNLHVNEPGMPLYSGGGRLPRTALGEAAWRLVDPLPRKGLLQGRDQLNEARRRVGLPPVSHVHGTVSRLLALVATFPHLEYPRRGWPPWARVVGPLLWASPDPPGARAPAVPVGGDPLVLIAPSTSQDPEGRLLRASLEGLADEPVRVLAATGRGALPPGMRIPPNASVASWLPYTEVMPAAAAVVCHAGHGTLGHALSAGAPVLASPGGGDMAEASARVAWSGAGLSLPRRLTTPRGVRLAVRRLLAEPSFAARARELAAWSAGHDAPAAGAAAVEGVAGGVRVRPGAVRTYVRGTRA